MDYVIYRDYIVKRRFFYLLQSGHQGRAMTSVEGLYSHLKRHARGTEKEARGVGGRGR